VCSSDLEFETFTISGLNPGTSYTIEARATAVGKTVSGTVQETFQTVALPTFTVRAKLTTPSFATGVPIQWEILGVGYSQSGQTSLNSSTYTTLRTDAPQDSKFSTNASESFVYDNQTFTFTRWRVNGVNQPLSETFLDNFNIDSDTDAEALYTVFGT
jgi:hypothetical protein